MGIAKIIPSILSSTPPWPGNISLVSLTLAFLLSKEMNKSPICEISEIVNVMIINEKKFN